MQRFDSFEKTLMLGKFKVGGEGDDRMRRVDGITYSIDMSLSKLRELAITGRPGVLQCPGSQRFRRD